MSDGHREFEVDFSLAVSGVLGEKEFAALSEHAQGCTQCAQRIEEMICVSVLLADARSFVWRQTAPSKMPAGMMDRFAVRAAAEGALPMRRKQASQPFFALAAVALVCVVLALIAHRSSARDFPSETAMASAVTGPQPETHAPSLGTAVQRRYALVRRRTAHRGAAGVDRNIDFSTAKVLDPRASFLRKTEATSTWNRLAIALPDSSPSCAGPAAQPMLSKFDAGEAKERRVFCYNPRMASLTSLDLFHAAALNAPPVFNLQAPAIRLPASTEQ